MKPDNFDANQISDTDMKKIEALKRAVSEGTYTVPAEDLALKLMKTMFRNTIFDEAPKQRAAREVPGGMMVSRKDSRSA